MLLRRVRDDIPASAASPAVERDGTHAVRAQLRREVSLVSVRKLAARAALLGLAAFLLASGGFGAAGVAEATASGATSGGPSPPPHPNV